jgi:hypothetical protein
MRVFIFTELGVSLLCLHFLESVAFSSIQRQCIFARGLPRCNMAYEEGDVFDQFDAAIPPPPGAPCVIKILGVGGGGGNAVNRMIQTRIEGVSFWAINTDAQALAKSLAPNILNIGRALTRGLGAGGDPQVGKHAAQENTQEIERICEGADMVFITAGMVREHFLHKTVDIGNRGIETMWIGC